MAHTYSPLTKSDNIYTPVSDVTPVTGVVEDKLTWAIINPAYDTWKEFNDYGKVHWCDWYYATPFVDAWASLTTPSKTYTGVTKSDNAFSPLTTPSQTYKEVTK